MENDENSDETFFFLPDLSLSLRLASRLRCSGAAASSVESTNTQQLSSRSLNQLNPESVVKSAYFT